MEQHINSLREKVKEHLLSKLIKNVSNKSDEKDNTLHLSQTHGKALVITLNTSKNSDNKQIVYYGPAEVKRAFLTFHVRIDARGEAEGVNSWKVRTRFP